MLPAFVVLHSNRDYHQWWQQTTADRRWTQYYDMMLTHSAVAAELRLFDLGVISSRLIKRCADDWLVSVCG